MCPIMPGCKCTAGRTTFRLLALAVHGAVKWMPAGSGAGSNNAQMSENENHEGR